MKKILAITLIFVLLASAASAADYKFGLPKETMVTVYSSSPGGMWYPIAIAMINVWQKYIPNLIVRLAPGGSIENARAIIRGDAEFSMTHTVTILNSIQGGNDAFKEPSDEIRAMAALGPIAIQIVVPKNSTIRSLADLSNRRIAFGNVGSLHNPAIFEILETEYGITPDSIVANGGLVTYLPDVDAIAAVQDEQVEVIVMNGTWPKVGYEELALRPGIRLIGIEEDVLKRFVARHPSWSIQIIPAVYTGFDEKVNSVKTDTIFACSKSADEEMVYQMTKAFWDNLDEAKTYSTDINMWTTIELGVSAAGAIPYHEGAIRYYKEIGMMK